MASLGSGDNSDGSAPRDTPLMIVSGAWQHMATDASGNLIWPDDPDEVPVWRHEREAWAAMAGVALPNCRTKRDWLRQLELAEIGVPSLIAVNIAGNNAHSQSRVIEPACQQRQSCGDSARAFLDAIRSEDIIGEYSSAELSSVYLDWCARDGWVPCPVDHVKAELGLMAGVHKRVIDQRDPDTKRRRRVVTWYVTPWSDMRPDESGDASDDTSSDVNIGDDMRLAA